MCLTQQGLWEEVFFENMYNYKLPILRAWGTEKPQTHQGPVSIVNENPPGEKVLNPGFTGCSKLQTC